MPKRRRLSSVVKIGKQDRLKKVGVIGVDSGSVIITDPAYTKGGKFGLPSYEDISKVSLKGKNQLKNKIGVNLAVVSGTGMGDGVYPVYAVQGEIIEGMGKNRTKALIVDFDTPKMRKLVKAVMKRQM